LVYIDFQAGSTDEVLEFGDQIVVNYTGWLQSTGVMFDSSVDGTTPYRLTLGIGNVIPGWDQGLVGLGVGGKRRLIIPPELAYGAAGSGDTIPPNSTLIFDVELVDILVKGAVTPTPAP
jgi:peptidylprolyl isomerase